MIVLATALLGLVGAQEAVTTPLTPFRDVPWTRSPQVEYPAAALSRGVDRGVVTIDCAVETTGALSDCRTIEDQPAELGFGRMALSAMRQARVDTARWTQPRVAVRLSFVSSEG
jgi:protein TonB